MDSYILIIGYGTTLSLIEQIEQHLSSFFLSSDQYNNCRILAPEVSSLLQPRNVYGIVIHENTDTQELEWLGPVEKAKVFEHLFTEEILSANPGLEKPLKDFTEQICGAIHLLADKLPAFGTYRLSVFLNYEILKDISVSDDPALASAFYRLSRWHAAHFSGFIQRNSDTSRLSEWCDILDADVLEEDACSQVVGPTLWKGSMEFKDPKFTENIDLKGLELRLDLEENNRTVFMHQSCSALPEKIAEEIPLHITLSSKMQIIDYCSYASIPPYLISTLIFRLHVGRPNMFNESLLDFLNNFSKQKEMAVIFRLYYATTQEKTRGEKKYCSSRWKRAISTGSIKDAETVVSSFENYITLVATRSSNSKHIIAHVIRDANTINPCFYFHSLNLHASKLSDSTSSDSKSSNLLTSVLKGIPFFETSLFYETIERLRMCNSQLAANSDISLKDKINKELDSVWRKEIRYASGESVLDNLNSTELTFEKIDPSDWPERVYLLNKQLQSERKEFLPNLLSNLGPKLPIQSVSFSSDDVQKYFLPSGECKNSAVLESIQPLSNLHTLHTFEAIVNTKWPNVLQYFYHDLYYNISNQSEEKEMIGSQMVNLYVKHETTSTCNKQQITQNFAIIIQSKSSPATKEFRSPSKRKILLAHKETDARGYSDLKENSVRELITKKILSTARFPSSQNLAASKKDEKGNHLFQNSSKRGVKRKIEVPTRFSPRKKKPVDYKSSTNGIAGTALSNKVCKSNELPELLKKKLRHAVATALENNGISLDDAFFKPCGKKLFTICQAFVQDLPQRKGKTSDHLQKIADAHVKQVIEFEKQKQKK